MNKYCKIKFSNSSSKLYDYFINVNGLEANDIVIVEAVDKIIPAYFVRYIDESENATKWVIDKFDSTDYEEKKKIIYDKQKIKEELNKEINKIDENIYLDILSSANPNIKLLYEALKSLEGE